VSLDLKKHEAFLKGAIAIEPKEQAILRSILHEFYHKKSESYKLSCSFYLIDCTIDEIREDDFIDLISRFIIVYSLKKSDYEDLDKYNAREIYKIARDKFTSLPLSGELGELILFALLESERNAPQIINKMSMKTDGNIHFHGLDAIHLGVWNNEMHLFYGSSKMYKKLSKGLYDSINDLAKFENDPKNEKLEINLINNNIDISKFNDYTSQLKEIISPYSKKEDLRIVYAIFIGFNWSSLKEIDFKKIDNIKHELEKCYSDQMDKIFKKCELKVSKSKIDRSFEFFFIPFKCVDDAREYFRKVM
jgi:hypothetical protein